MTINVAHIKNGIVDNIAVYETMPVASGDEDLQYVEVTGFPIGVGWEYADGTFSSDGVDYIYKIDGGKIDLTPSEE